MKYQIWSLAIIAPALGLPAAGLAQAVPHLISFSGHLADAGAPVTGSHDLTFALFDAVSGGNPVCGGWSDTNAGTICGTGQYLNGDGVCDTGFLDADGVDAYNAAFDTEAEIDAAVANNNYSTGPHTTDTNTNAGTLCGNNEFLDGDGSCHPQDSSATCGASSVCMGGATHTRRLRSRPARSISAATTTPTVARTGTSTSAARPWCRGTTSTPTAGRLRVTWRRAVRATFSRVRSP